MKLRWLLAVSVIIVGFLAGYVSAPVPATTPPGGGATSPGTAGKIASRESSASDAERAALLARITRAARSASPLRRDGALADIAAGLSTAQIQEILEDARNRDPAYFKQLLTPLLRQWASRDPATAAAFVARSRLIGYDHAGAVSTIIQAWLFRDPAALNRWLRTISFSNTFLSEITSSPEFIASPASALQRLLDGGLFGERTGAPVLTNAIREWVKTDPRAALNFAAALKDPQLRRSAAGVPFEAWLQANEADALRWFEESSDAILRDSLTPSLVRTIARKDPVRAEALVNAMQPGSVRDSAFSVFLAITAPKDPARLAAMAEEIAFDPRYGPSATLYSKWIAADPGAAIASFLRRAEEDDPELYTSTFQQVIRNSVSSRDSFTRIGDALIQGAAEPPTSVARAGLWYLAMSWAERDIDGLTKWLESVPEGRRREELIVPAAGQIVFRRPQNVVPWLAALPPGRSQAMAVSQAVETLMPRDLAGTRAAIEVLPESDRAATFSAAWKNWARRERETAESWRDTNPGLSDAERAALRVGK